VVGVRTCHKAVAKVRGSLAAFDGTDLISERSVLWTKTMAIIGEGDRAMKDTAARMTDSYAVNNNDMNFVCETESVLNLAILLVLGTYLRSRSHPTRADIECSNAPIQAVHRVEYVHCALALPS
jgi:hypothetical protein